MMWTSAFQKTSFFRNVTLGLLLGGPLWAKQRTFWFNNRHDIPLVAQRLLISRRKFCFLKGITVLNVWYSSGLIKLFHN